MKKIYAVFAYELKEAVRKSKLLLVLFFVVMLYESILSPMQAVCAQTGFTVGCFEPFILICSKSTNTILIPLLYIFIISGFPYCKTSYFHILRAGKKPWLCGEVIFVIVSSLGLLLCLCAGSVIPIAENVVFTGEWSKYMLDVYTQDPELYMKNSLLFLDSSYTLHGTPFFEAAYSFLVMWLNLCITGIIVLLGSVTGKELLFSIIAVCTVLIGGSSMYFAGDFKWLFPLTHTQYGLHFNLVFSGNNFPVAMTFVYLVAALIVGIVLCFIAARKMNFDMELT